MPECYFEVGSAMKSQIDADERLYCSAWTSKIPFKAVVKSH